jgi:hypothetical protein
VCWCAWTTPAAKAIYVSLVRLFSKVQSRVRLSRSGRSPSARAQVGRGPAATPSSWDSPATLEAAVRRQDEAYHARTEHEAKCVVHHSSYCSVDAVQHRGARCCAAGVVPSPSNSGTLCVCGCLAGPL